MKLKKSLVCFLVLLLVLFASADTTFFDNTDDVFILSNFPTGEVIGKTTGGGGCSYEWNCTNWSECLPSGKQIRNCTNMGMCSNPYNSPNIEQNCIYTVSPKVEEKENVTEESYFSTANVEILKKNKIPLYAIIILILVSIILYLKKDYLKEQVKK